MKVKYKEIRYIVLDIDGTMTDGSIYYNSSGDELKKFNTSDAAGILALRKMKIVIIIITGRECIATLRRMRELEIDYIFQNIKEKKTFLRHFMQENHIMQEEIGYIGDDLNDLSAMKMVGFVACPKNSCKEVKKISNYISEKEGGKGAVRDISEYILKKRKEWDVAIKKIYDL